MQCGRAEREQECVDRHRVRIAPVDVRISAAATPTLAG
jgi:hypothetical protein